MLMTLSDRLQRETWTVTQQQSVCYLDTQTDRQTDRQTYSCRSNYTVDEDEDEDDVTVSGTGDADDVE